MQILCKVNKNEKNLILVNIFIDYCLTVFSVRLNLLLQIVF